MKMVVPDMMISHTQDALEIFRNRSAYKTLRDYLVLPCVRLLKLYFENLVLQEVLNRVKLLVRMFFQDLRLPKTCITADENHVKAAISYHDVQVIGLSVD